MNVKVVIDVFRAFTTASYVLERSPTFYALAVKQNVISEMASQHMNPLIIGKPERGMGEHNIYHIPNSPTRVCDVEINERDIIHRTEAGAKGVLLAKDADVVLAAGFVNASATAKYIQSLENPKVTIIPMGHEGTTSSLEDTLCAEYIQGLIEGRRIDITPYLTQLREGPGNYFFSADQWQYPSEDFDRCMEIDRFDFAIQALVQGDFAILKRC